MIDGRILADYAYKQFIKYILIAVCIALLIGGLIGYALAFEITWNDDPQDGAAGYRLYRHPGPCSDPVKRWRFIQSYPSLARRGEIKNSIRPTCYAMRAYWYRATRIRLSRYSNEIEWPVVVP